MYLPSTTPSQRAFNSKRVIARSNIEGAPMSADLAGIELAKLKRERAALTEIVSNLKREIEDKSQELASLKVEAFDLGAKVDRYKIALSDFNDEHGPSIATVKKVVARAYGIPLRDLKGNCRLKADVRQRQVGMYLCKTLTGQSLQSIGRSFGGKDHSTVLHAVRKLARLRLTDQRLDDELGRLSAMIMERATK